MNIRYGPETLPPPLQCARCGASRWNDESVTWLPLRGLYRHPYCSFFCAHVVMMPCRNEEPKHLLFTESDLWGR